MSVPSEVFEDLYDDNQKTSAYGWSPRVAATQNGNWDPVLNAVVQLSTQFGSNGTVDDARDWAFRDITGLSKWKKSEASGIHAEVLIIRAWIAMGVINQGLSIPQATAALQGRAIYASQPACWCCHALMGQLGIVRGNDALGKKPLSGWRHPLGGRTVPNSALPTQSSSINATWLNGSINY